MPYDYLLHLGRFHALLIIQNFSPVTQLLLYKGQDNTAIEATSPHFRGASRRSNSSALSHLSFLQFYLFLLFLFFSFSLARITCTSGNLIFCILLFINSEYFEIACVTGRQVRPLMLLNKEDVFFAKQTRNTSSIILKISKCFRLMEDGYQRRGKRR